ncbi:hypothetical protein Slin14017_G116500 [Septoria linicola]|nr:hypothetical protein Slin14017_G116500 [Septoria linicola]
MKKSISATKASLKQLKSMSTAPRSLLQFLERQNEIELDIHSDMAAQRIYVLQHNPNIITPSSRNNLLAFLQSELKHTSRETRLQDKNIIERSESLRDVYALARRPCVPMLQDALSTMKRDLFTPDLRPMDS